MQKKYLMTPVPTPVPAEVLLTQAAPIIHHRTLRAREHGHRTLTTTHATDFEGESRPKETTTDIGADED